MKKPQGSATFLKDDNNVLWIGLLMRDSGTLASDRLGIKDEVVALEFDLAVSHRLLRFDTEVMTAQSKRIAYECGKMFFGTKEDDVLDATELHPLIAADKYADGNTKIS